jgi:exocyst complex component 3
VSKSAKRHGLNHKCFFFQEAAAKFEVLLTTFQELRGEAAGHLLDESFLDIDVHFADLLTSKWMTSTDAIDTVCATLVS